MNHALVYAMERHISSRDGAEEVHIVAALKAIRLLLRMLLKPEPTLLRVKRLASLPVIFHGIVLE